MRVWHFKRCDTDPRREHSHGPLCAKRQQQSLVPFWPPARSHNKWIMKLIDKFPHRFLFTCFVNGWTSPSYRALTHTLTSSTTGSSKCSTVHVYSRPIMVFMISYAWGWKRERKVNVFFLQFRITGGGGGRRCTLDLMGSSTPFDLKAISSFHFWSVRQLRHV